MRPSDRASEKDDVCMLNLHLKSLRTDDFKVISHQYC